MKAIKKTHPSRFLGVKVDNFLRLHNAIVIHNNAHTPALGTKIKIQD